MPIEIQSEANLAVSYFRYKTQENVKCDTGNTVQLFPAQVSLSTAYYFIYFKSACAICKPDACTIPFNFKNKTDVENTIDVRCFLEEDQIDEATLERFTFVVEVV